MSRRTCTGKVTPDSNILFSSPINLATCWLEVMRVMQLWWKVDEKRGIKEIGLKVDPNLPITAAAVKLSVTHFIIKA